MSKSYCFIPARGGSKGMPGKNLKMLHGIPLVDLSVLAAYQSGIFENIFVSSDDEAIISSVSSLSVFLNSGKIFNIKRPASISGDLSTTEQAIFHFIENVKEINDDDIIFMLQPTSPFRHNNLIEKFYKGFLGSSLKSGFTASCVTPFLWRNNSPMYDINKRKMRQEIGDDELFMHEDGNIYCFYKSNFCQFKNRISNPCFIYKNNEVNSLQIDTSLDMTICQSVAMKDLEVVAWLQELYGL